MKNRLILWLTWLDWDWVALIAAVLLTIATKQEWVFVGFMIGWIGAFLGGVIRAADRAAYDRLKREEHIDE